MGSLPPSTVPSYPSNGESWRITDLEALCSHVWKRQVRTHCESSLPVAVLPFLLFLTPHPKVRVGKGTACQLFSSHCGRGWQALLVPQAYPELLNWRADFYVEQASFICPWSVKGWNHARVFGRFLGWSRFIGGQGNPGSRSLLRGAEHSLRSLLRGIEGPKKLLIIFSRAWISSH